jgi:hypothetical protein
VFDLATDLALALDPVGLAEQAGFYPDRWQRNVLRSASPRMLLNCCRQSGKSTTVATLVMHTAIYQPGSLTLILSPGERQSKETFKKCLALYKALDRPIPAEAETKLELELENGSRVVSLPGSEGTVRGYSGVNLLCVDEASRVPDALYQAVRPMLAVSGGRLIALSTPWGQRGFFYEAWERGGSTWERYEVPASHCPRISAEFLQEERATLPDLFFKSEYLCQFVDAMGQYFATEDVLGAVSSDVAPLFGAAAALESEEECLPLFSVSTSGKRTTTQL